MTWRILLMRSGLLTSQASTGRPPQLGGPSYPPSPQSCECLQTIRHRVALISLLSFNSLAIERNDWVPLALIHVRNDWREIGSADLGAIGAGLPPCRLHEKQPPR